MDEEDNDPIGKAIGVTQVNPVLDRILNDSHDASVSKDFEMARANVYEIIESGKAAFMDLAQLASQSQNPQMYAVMVKMIDSLVLANKQLLDLQNTVKDIKGSSPKGSGPHTVNQTAIFMGSTAELQKAIRDMGIVPHFKMVEKKDD
jgi:hypothetical protein